MNRKCNILVAAVAVTTALLAGCATHMNSKSASASTTETGQVIQWVIGPADVGAEGILFLDLDRNRVFKPPMVIRFSQLEGLEITPALSEWLLENGVDLLVQLVPHVKVAGSATTIPGAHLRGIYLRGVVVLDDEDWRRSKGDSSGKSWPTPDPKWDLGNSRLLGQGAPVYRALLRTQERRLFALELADRAPDRVTIRYETVAMR